MHATQLPQRNMKLLSKLLPTEELNPGSVANLSSQSVADVRLRHGTHWCWELYDVDVQPSSWKHGREEGRAFPFGLTALDVETIEMFQQTADDNAYDEASDVRLNAEDGADIADRSWFGSPDDAIVVVFASKQTRPAAAVRLLRLDSRRTIQAREQSLAYEDERRKKVDHHDPVEGPAAHADRHSDDARVIARELTAAVDRVMK